MHGIKAIYGMYGAALLTSLLSACALLYSIHQTPVVTFDKEVVMKQFVTQLSHQNTTEKKTKQLSNQFAIAVKESLDDYAKEHHAIVIKKEMVLATSADVTSEIAQRIVKKMRGGR